MKRISSCLLAAMLICVFVLTACAPAAATETPAATAAPAATEAPSATEAPATTEAATDSAPVTLEFWAYASMVQSGFGEYMKAQIAEFEASHPNVTVNLTGKNDDDLLAGLVTSAASGTMPDVFIDSTGNGGALLAAGAVGNIYDRWTAMPQDFRDQFYPANVAMVTPQEGVMYAVPYTGYGNLMYRNLTVLRAAGIDPSQPVTTWDEWLAQMKKIKDAGYTAIPNMATTWFGFGSIYSGIATQAEWGIDFANNTTLINPDAWAKTAEFLIEAKPYTSELPALDQGMTDQFIANQLAYYFCGAWCDPTFQDAKKSSGLDYDWALIPGATADEHGGCSGYEIMSINTKGPNADLAWEFLTFMVGKESMTKMAEAVGQFNANKAAMEASAADSPLIAITMKAADGAIYNTPPFFIEPYPTNYISTMQDNMTSIYEGQMTPEEGAAKLIQDLNAVVAERNQ